MVELEQLNKKMELVMDEKDHQLKVNRIFKISKMGSKSG